MALKKDLKKQTEKNSKTMYKTRDKERLGIVRPVRRQIAGVQMKVLRV